MSVEEAILELLKVHNRVIVPGFGAFLVAKDDVDSKPYVLFNGFLSFNDGLLVDYLAEKSGIDSIVSADNVTEYVYTIKHSLQEDKIYKFNFLGVFDFEESGSMRFRFNPNIGKTPQKPVVHAKPTTKKEEAKKESKISKSEVDTSFTPISEPKNEVVQTENHSKSHDSLLELDKNNMAPDVIIEPEISSSKSERLPLTNSSFELDKEDTTVNSSTSPEISTDTPESKTKKRRLVAILILLIPLLLASFYIFFSYLPNKRSEEIRKIAMENEAKKQLALKIQTDSIELIKIRELALADSLQLADESRATLTTGYHLIVGAFAEEANADKMVAKLKTSNFPKAQKIKTNNRFMVSVDASLDREEAIKQLRAVTSSANIDCWLYQIK